MAHWLRFAHRDSIGFGMVDKDTIQVTAVQNSRNSAADLLN